MMHLHESSSADLTGERLQINIRCRGNEIIIESLTLGIRKLFEVLFLESASMIMLDPISGKRVTVVVTKPAILPAPSFHADRAGRSFDRTGDVSPVRHRQSPASGGHRSPSSD
jgi:hypothetical protein